MNGKAKAWAVALLAAVLLAGAAAGVVVERTLLREGVCGTHTSRRSDGRNHRDGHLEWLAVKLDLSAGQQAEVEELVEANRDAMSKLWRETRPRFEELKSQLHADIREVLTEEQRVAYEALLERQSRRRERDSRNQK